MNFTYPQGDEIEIWQDIHPAYATYRISQGINGKSRTILAGITLFSEIIERAREMKKAGGLVSFPDITIVRDINISSRFIY